jgi:SAM-dependent methyltransferase
MPRSKALEGGHDCPRVISTGSLHHWEAPLAGLTEAHRVLRAGGYALIYGLVRHLPEPVVRDVRTRFVCEHGGHPIVLPVK